MIVIFLIISIIVFALTALIVLNFWKYRYKGDKVPLFVIILFSFLAFNLVLTLGYLMNSSLSVSAGSEENWTNIE